MIFDIIIKPLFLKNIVLTKYIHLKIFDMILIRMAKTLTSLLNRYALFFILIVLVVKLIFI